mmetsp:Transcript_9795/g.16038  ORF Transcript_9795/g.16038 Transcript_9795/m.16038 type:complete len:389 (+) Transcript_9795:2201-3367(+)
MMALAWWGDSFGGVPEYDNLFWAKSKGGVLENCVEDKNVYDFHVNHALNEKVGLCFASASAELDVDLVLMPVDCNLEPRLDCEFGGAGYEECTRHFDPGELVLVGRVLKLVTPVLNLKYEISFEKALQQCVLEGMSAAVDYGARSIGILVPNLSEVWLHVFLRTSRRFVERYSDAFTQVVFIVQREMRLFTELKKLCEYYYPRTWREARSASERYSHISHCHTPSCCKSPADDDNNVFKRFGYDGGDIVPTYGRTEMRALYEADPYQDNEPWYSVEFVGTLRRRISFAHSITYYNILVTVVNSCGDTMTSWNVLHRYSDFRQLALELNETKRHFPPRTMFWSSLKQTVVRQRFIVLQTWLRKMILKWPSEIYDFVHMPSAGTEIVYNF